MMQGHADQALVGHKPAGGLMPNVTGNRLLDALSAETQKRVLSGARMVDLPLRAPLFHRDEQPSHTYFPVSGLASLVYTSERGTTIELATVGNEGCVGWLFLLGHQPSNADAMMQVPGQGYRVAMPIVQRVFEESAEFRGCVLEYAQYQSLVAFQIAACNRLHRAPARFARWLLMAQDKLQTDNLAMTQEFLSHMLGTRRTTVAEVVGELQREGVLEGRRGGLHIVDRKKLEERACECYGVVQRRSALLFQHGA